MGYFSVWCLRDYQVFFQTAYQTSHLTDISWMTPGLSVNPGFSVILCAGTVIVQQNPYRGLLTWNEQNGDFFASLALFNLNFLWLFFFSLIVCCQDYRNIYNKSFFVCVVRCKSRNSFVDFLFSFSFCSSNTLYSNICSYFYL